MVVSIGCLAGGLMIRILANEGEKFMMKTDTVTKILLALIALGLWLNLMGWKIGPGVAAAAVAQEDDAAALAHIEMMVDSIDENLEIIALGSCMNARLC